MKLQECWTLLPDPRGAQGKDYKLSAILNLVITGYLCGRQNLRAVFRFGRGLKRDQRRALGFTRGDMPCHATLTETLRYIDGEALAKVLGVTVTATTGDGTLRHLAIDGKTLRASKDGNGKAVHCLSAFCRELQAVAGQTASRGTGLEIPDALKLLETLELEDTVVTGDAIFCQKEITDKIVNKGGGYLFPVKDNQKTLKEDIETAFKWPVSPP